MRKISHREANQAEEKNVNFGFVGSIGARSARTGLIGDWKSPPATRFYVISSKDMQINVLINNRLYRGLATGRVSVVMRIISERFQTIN